MRTTPKPEDPCPFCEIIAGRANAEIVYADDVVVIFTPLNPVTPGHVLVVPCRHVEDFSTDPTLTGEVMRYAARYARWRDKGPMNLITSKGKAATQSVFHLHVHLVPRREGDGLHLPWTDQHKEQQS